MSKRWGSRASKPLATKSGQELMPIIMVDFDVGRCGPRLPRSMMVADPDHPTSGLREYVSKAPDPWVFNPDQAAVAASQWGSSAAPHPGDRPWLKSWNYPTDAFDPWPERTDLCCWWCTHGFDWAPFPMPAAKDKLTGKYRVLGVFCGPSCAKAYAGDGDRFANRYSIFAWIDEIAFKYYGYATPGGRAPLIPRAPRRELLQRYCGPKGLTIDQYRTLCAHGRSLILHRPGFVTEKQIVEAEDANARMMSTRVKLSSSTAKKPSTSQHQPQQQQQQSAGGYHPENPDCILTTTELVNAARTVFAGKGTKPLSAFFAPQKQQFGCGCAGGPAPVQFGGPAPMALSKRRSFKRVVGVRARSPSRKVSVGPAITKKLQAMVNGPKFTKSKKKRTVRKKKAGHRRRH